MTRLGLGAALVVWLVGAAWSVFADESPPISRGIEFYCLQMNKTYYTAQVWQDKDSSVVDKMLALFYDLYSRMVVNTPESVPVLFGTVFVTLLVFVWLLAWLFVRSFRPLLRWWLWHKSASFQGSTGDPAKDAALRQAAYDLFKDKMDPGRVS